MPTTNERVQAARRTDQEIKDDQQRQLDEAREERNKKLKIGNHTEE